jgi:hypothetical protein
MNTNELSFRMAMDGITEEILEAYQEAKMLDRADFSQATNLYAERIHGSLERALEKLAPMGIHGNALWHTARQR